MPITYIVQAYLLGRIGGLFKLVHVVGIFCDMNCFFLQLHDQCFFNSKALIHCRGCYVSLLLPQKVTIEDKEKQQDTFFFFTGDTGGESLNRLLMTPLCAVSQVSSVALALNL